MGKNMKTLSIKTKTIVLITALIIIMAVIISQIAIYQINTLTKSKTEQYREGEYKEKTLELTHNVEIINNIITQYEKKYGAEAKNKVIELVKNIRFADNSYFWIHDINGNMIMHPIQASINGKNFSELKDSSGKLFFKEMQKLLFLKTLYI